MAITNPVPAAKITPLRGDVITIQVRPVIGSPNEVIYHIERNGATEARFTLTEFRQVLTTLQTLATEAQAHALNNPELKS